MSMQRTPMTRTGFERLRDELDRLKRVERPTIIKAIAEARAHGDLSENAEYHAAGGRKSLVGGRITEWGGRVKGAGATGGRRGAAGWPSASPVRLETGGGREAPSGSAAPTRPTPRRAASRST